jgi:hypothetical protein
LHLYLIPDEMGMDAFNATYRQAKQQRAVFVAEEHQGERRTVKADVITASEHVVEDSEYDAIRTAVIRLIRSRGDRHVLERATALVPECGVFADMVQQLQGRRRRAG